MSSISIRRLPLKAAASLNRMASFRLVESLPLSLRYSHNKHFHTHSVVRQQNPGTSSHTSQKFRSTLGPDASNPTTISQPTFTKSGQLLRVDISESAAKKLKQVSLEDKRPDMILRIHVESGGCHGFQYVFQLPDASDIKKTDSVFERDGARVVIDHKSLRILRDATIEYTTELIGSQFKVTSPHTSSSCGCGSSFSLDMED